MVVLGENQEDHTLHPHRADLEGEQGLEQDGSRGRARRGSTSVLHPTPADDLKHV